MTPAPVARAPATPAKLTPVPYQYTRRRDHRCRGNPCMGSGDPAHGTATLCLQSEDQKSRLMVVNLNVPGLTVAAAGVSEVGVMVTSWVGWVANTTV